MSLPQVLKKQVEQVLRLYCEAKVPPHARSQVRVDFKFRSNSVTLFETRLTLFVPTTWVDIVVAQFRYDEESKHWTLYWADRNAKWHLYDGVAPTTTFADLLGEVDKDPTGIFWG